MPTVVVREVAPLQVHFVPEGQHGLSDAGLCSVLIYGMGMGGFLNSAILVG